MPRQIEADTHFVQSEIYRRATDPKITCCWKYRPATDHVSVTQRNRYGIQVQQGVVHLGPLLRCKHCVLRTRPGLFHVSA